MKKHSSLRNYRSPTAHATGYIAALLLAICSSVCAQSAPQMDLPRTALSAGIYRFEVQIARTPQEQEIGLMFRSAMPQNEGMLFVFPEAHQQCFWMKNTQIPLTAAFVAADGTIVNLEDMKAQTTDSHCSAKPVPYVLEMNQGWFAKKGIKAGMHLSSEAFQH